MLVVLVEGHSEIPVMKSLLEKAGVKPQNYQIVRHEGVGDLTRKLRSTLRAWRDPETRFLVLRDNDRGDCKRRKSELTQIVEHEHKLPQSKVRIACQEIEAWFLGDANALVSAGILRAKKHPSILKRDPDSVAYPAREIHKLRPDFGKITAAEKIAKFLDLDQNRSRSFQNTVRAIKSLTV